MQKNIVLKYKEAYLSFIKTISLFILLVATIPMTYGDNAQAPKNNIILESSTTNSYFPAVPLPPQKSNNLSKFTAGQVVTDNFTDSQGRTLLYRFSTPSSFDPAEPQKIMLYFHGNNTGTQNDMLDSFFPFNEYMATQRGLIPIVVASPELSGSGTRSWRSEDKLLIYEFLQNGLVEHFDIDMSQIFFLGGSQGACFLSNFIQEYGENYGGGLAAGCGCYYPLNPTWSPSEEFISAFKVHIATTTEDFLYTTSQAGYGYYKYTIGLNTRGDFNQSGTHCSAHWTQTETALDWLTGANNILDEEFRPYWKRISLMDEVKGLTIDSNSKLWAVQQTNTTTSKLWRSTDKGKNWQSVSENSVQSKDLDSSSGNLFLSTDNGLLKSSNGGASFTPIAQNQTYPYNVVTDTQNHLYRDGFPVQFSEDQGDTWQVLNTNSNAILNRESIFLGSSPKLLTSTVASDTYYGLNNGNFYIDSINPSESSSISDTESGSILNVAWDGQTLWGLGDTTPSSDHFDLFKSTNMGSTWTEVALPFDKHYKYGAKISAIATGKIIIHGGLMANVDYSSWLSEDSGQTWKRIPGLETATNGTIVTKDGENIYYTDGEAIFRFIGSAIEQPHEVIKRAEISKPLLLKKHGNDFTPTNATGAIFTDVQVGDFNSNWIEQLEVDGITEGCSVDKYCPDRVVTKEQLSKILLKAKYGSAYNPPSATGNVFTDVSINQFSASWIEALVTEGISDGCDENKFCPNEVVTTQAFFLMLNKTFP